MTYNDMTTTSGDFPNLDHQRDFNFPLGRGYAPTTSGSNTMDMTGRSLEMSDMMAENIDFADMPSTAGMVGAFGQTPQLLSSIGLASGPAFDGADRFPTAASNSPTATNIDTPSHSYGDSSPFASPVNPQQPRFSPQIDSASNYLAAPPVANTGRSHPVQVGWNGQQRDARLSNLMIPGTNLNQVRSPDSAGTWNANPFPIDMLYLAPAPISQPTADSNIPGPQIELSIMQASGYRIPMPGTGMIPVTADSSIVASTHGGHNTALMGISDAFPLPQEAASDDVQLPTVNFSQEQLDQVLHEDTAFSRPFPARIQTQQSAADGSLPYGYNPTRQLAPSYGHSLTATSDVSYGPDNNPSPISSVSDTPFAGLPFARSAPPSAAGDHSSQAPSHRPRAKVPGVPDQMVGRIDFAPKSLKRIHSATALPSEEPGYPAKKKCHSSTCLSCYLAHKPCEYNGALTCERCRKSPGSYPVCIRPWEWQNIFHNSLEETDKKLVQDIIAAKSYAHLRADRALAAYTSSRRSVDMKPALEILSELKFGDKGAFVSFFEKADVRQRHHTIFAPFYQASVVLQGRAVLRKSETFVYDDQFERNVLVVLALSAARALRFLQARMEKNKMHADMKRESPRARNIVVFLAILLEQSLAFEKIKPEGFVLTPELTEQRDKLVYHLAYHLRYMAGYAFEKDNSLPKDVHVGIDNDVCLKDGFYKNLGAQLAKAERGDKGKNPEKKEEVNNETFVGRDVPTVLVTQPTFPRDGSAEASTTATAATAAAAAAAAQQPRRRSRKKEKPDEASDNRDNVDASSLMEVRTTADADVVEVAAQFEELHVRPDSPIHEFVYGKVLGNEWTLSGTDEMFGHHLGQSSRSSAEYEIFGLQSPPEEADSQDMPDLGVYVLQDNTVVDPIADIAGVGVLNVPIDPPLPPVGPVGPVGPPVALVGPLVDADGTDLAAAENQSNVSRDSGIDTGSASSSRQSVLPRRLTRRFTTKIKKIFGQSANR